MLILYLNTNRTFGTMGIPATTAISSAAAAAATVLITAATEVTTAATALATSATGVRAGNVRQQERIKWKRNARGGGDVFWQPLREACQVRMDEWQRIAPYFRAEDALGKQAVESVWTSFKAAAIGCLADGLGRKGRRLNWNGKAYKIGYSDKHISRLKREYQCNYRRMLEEVTDEGKQARWNECRLIRLAIRKRVRQGVKNEKQKRQNQLIEMRTKDCKEYWNQLRQYAGAKRESQALPPGVLNEKKELVSNEEAVVRVWGEAWERLGKDRGEEAEFDEAHAAAVREEVKWARERGWESTDVDEADGRCEREMKIMNAEVTIDDVRAAVAKMKTMKATGIDDIASEVFIYGGESVLHAVLRVVRAVWRAESVPMDWVRGVIFPLYKNGDRRDPSNYRGISLLSVVGKLLTTVLNTRIVDWSERMAAAKVRPAVLSEEQGGFRPRRGCLDQLFVLVEALRVRRQRGTATFACFIDVRKAYDTVFRDGMWKRLYDAGLRGKIMRVLYDIYEKSESAVIVNGVCSQWFRSEVGVRQGCVLSPVLFSIFMNPLIEELRASGLGINVDGVGLLASLFYADDIVLLASSAHQLQQMMDLVQRYFGQWRLEANAGKTKVVVFCSGGKRQEALNREMTSVQFWIGSTSARVEVMIVRSFVYLGMLVQQDGSWHEFQTKVVHKARTALLQAWRMGVQGGVLDVQAGVLIWTSLIRPILEYGAELWPSSGKDKWLAAEKVQRTMAKRILGCSPSAANEFVLGELGWVSLQARRDMLRLRLWYRIVHANKDRIVYKVYRAGKEQLAINDRCAKGGWCEYTRSILQSLELGDRWDTEDLGEAGEWAGVVKVAIRVREQKKWRDNMRAKSSLRLYRLIKTNLCREFYLRVNDGFARRGRIITARLRGSVSGLRISHGRHEQLPESDRVCRSCLQERKVRVVEDEIHFLLYCDSFDQQRMQFWEQVREIDSQNEVWGRLADAETLRGEVARLEALVEHSQSSRRRSVLAERLRRAKAQVIIGDATVVAVVLGGWKGDARQKLDLTAKMFLAAAVRRRLELLDCG